jgi:hypothetical protein
MIIDLNIMVQQLIVVQALFHDLGRLHVWDYIVTIMFLLHNYKEFEISMCKN